MGRIESANAAHWRASGGRAEPREAGREDRGESVHVHAQLWRRERPKENHRDVGVWIHPLKTMFGPTGLSLIDPLRDGLRVFFKEQEQHMCAADGDLFLLRGSISLLARTRAHALAGESETMLTSGVSQWRDRPTTDSLLRRLTSVAAAADERQSPAQPTPSTLPPTTTHTHRNVWKIQGQAGVTQL